MTPSTEDGKMSHRKGDRIVATRKSKKAQVRAPKTLRPRLPIYFRTEQSKTAVLADAKKYHMSGNDYVNLVLSWRKVINEMIDRGEIII